LLKVTFEHPTEDPGDRKKEFEEFLDWRPGNFLEVKWGAALEEKVMMHGFFKTKSSSAIVSMPMDLWDSLPQKPAYEFISVVRSLDLLNELNPAPALLEPVHPQSVEVKGNKASVANVTSLIEQLSVPVPKNGVMLSIPEGDGGLPVILGGKDTHVKRKGKGLM
jgi:hypothetical protein